MENVEVVSFRCDTEFKQKILAYGLLKKMVDDTGRPVASEIVFKILKQFFKEKGAVKEKLEWRI